MTDIHAKDYPTLQAAFDDAAATGKTLHLTPRTQYAVTAPIVLDNVSVRLDGHGATIGADVPMLAPLALKNGAYLQAKHLTLGGGRVALYAMHCAGAGGSHFEDCEFYFGVRDGVHLAAEGAAGGNDCMRFERCRFQHNGRMHRLTVTINQTNYPPVAGYGTEPSVEAPDAQFVTWGTRIGDLLHVGSEWLLVQEVIDETHLKLQLYPGSEGHTAAAATLHIGDGYHEESFNDNNLVVLRDCLFRNNAGAGAKLCGLFGARVQSGQFDFNKTFGAIVGHRSGAVIISSFRDCYFEGNEAPSAILLGGAQGVEISSVNSDKPITSVTNPTPSWGTVLNAQPAPGLRQASPNGVISQLPVVP